jgi:hypothetical protein
LRIAANARRLSAGTERHELPGLLSTQGTDLAMAIEKPEFNLDAELSRIADLSRSRYGISGPFETNLMAMITAGSLEREAVPAIREALERGESFRHDRFGDVALVQVPGALGITIPQIGLVVFLHN